MNGPVPLSEAMREYSRFRKQFAAILDPAYYTIEWLDERVRSGEFQVFTAADSAILTQVKTYPTGLKELHGQVATGELREILSVLIPSALNFGRSIGCRVAVIESREGWSRALRGEGWETYQTAIRQWL